MTTDPARGVLAVHSQGVSSRVPTPRGKSWIFFLENSRTWKVLEKYPENYAFFIGSNGKQAEIVNVPVCVDFYLLK